MPTASHIHQLHWYPKMNRIFILLAVTALYGCAASSTWQKEGVNLNGMSKELFDCRYSVGKNTAAPTNHAELINDCMRDKGFVYR